MGRPRPDRLVAWVLAAFAVVAALWWSFFYPYRESLLLGVFPSGTVAVTSHERLAERWSDLAACPQLDAAFEVFGGGRPGAWRAQLESEGVRRIVDIVGRRRIVSGYVPAFGRAQRPAWVAVGWAGGYTQLLRFGFLDDALGDFTPCLLAGASKGWVSRFGEGNHRVYVGMVVLEGVVGLVVAEDAWAIHDLAARMRLRGARAPIGLLGAVGSTMSGPLDRLAGSEALAVASVPGTWMSRAAIVELGPSGIAIEGDVVMDKGAALVEGPMPDLISRLPSDLSSVQVVTPVSNVFAMTRFYGGREAAQVVSSVVDGLVDRAGSCLVAVGGHGYAGRIVGVPVPSIMVACPLEDAATRDFVGVLRQQLERLNQLYGAGVMVVPSATTPGLLGVAPVRSGALLLPGGSAWVHVGCLDGWLLVSTDEGVLARVMGHVRARKGVVGRGGEVALAVDVNGDDAAWVVERILAFYRIWALLPQGRKAAAGVNVEALEQWRAFLARAGNWQLVAHESESGVSVAVELR